MIFPAAIPFLRGIRRLGIALGLWLLWLASTLPVNAVVLWSDSGPLLVHENGAGTDILGGAVKRDGAANDTLYFKFHVTPTSDINDEDYLAAFELYDGGMERLGIGNALKAWAYSAFPGVDETGDSRETPRYYDLRSARPEPLTNEVNVTYQFPHKSVGVTFLVKIQYVPDEDDVVTIWLNPDLGPGTTEVGQPETLTTRFNANATFDEIRLRHNGRGAGWTFTDMMVATTFSDFVDASSARPNQDAASASRAALAFGFRSWQKEQGLPQSPVRALAQTKDGYLWLGTDEGIVRFDGMRFVSFGPREGYSISPVRSLLGDSSGALLIGTLGGGLGRWQDGRYSAYTIQDGLISGSISALAEDDQGKVWIGTDMGLCFLQNGLITTTNSADEFRGKHIAALAEGRQGGMWVGVRGTGVYRFNNGQFTPLKDSAEDSPLKEPHCLLADRAGKLWIGAGDDFVLCYEEDHWQRYRIPRRWVKAAVNTFAEDDEGTVWAGSMGGGLLEFKEGKFLSVGNGNGLTGNLIESLFTDRDGTLWVGTDAGLNRMHRRSLSAFGQGEGLGFGAVQGLAEVAPGVIWAGKPGGGIYRWDGRNFNRLTTAGLSARDAQAGALLVARDGCCWVASMRGLLLYKDPIASADEVRLFELPGHNIISLAEDNEGAILAGTREGKLWRLQQGQWEALENPAPTNAITCLTLDKEGAIWVGTDGDGLFHLKRSGTVSRFDRSNGLQSEVIRTLHLDADGTLWIGTANGGLSRWRDEHLNTFTTQEGLQDNNVSQIVEDDANRLWLGTSEGIACVSKRRIDEFIAKKIPSVYPRIFGRADGMLSDECTSGFSPAGLKAKSGLLWFTTMKGAVAIDPHMLMTNTPAPTVVLEEFLVDGNAAPGFIPRSSNVRPAPRTRTSPNPTPPPLRIAPGKHRIELRYTSLNFEAPDSMRFRYQLEGLDTDWVEAGARRTAIYPFLPPGDYRFRVAVCNSEGIWSENNVELPLVVLRHFWQAAWFIFLASATVLGLVIVIVRFSVRRKMQQRVKRLEQERALERERTRIAQDLHDEMGAKLCRISYLSEHARRGDISPAELQSQIASISDASREVLHSLDEIVWAVNPQNDTLEHVASYIGQYAQDYFQMTGITCELDIPGQLPPHPLSSQSRHHLFLATHEAFTNILKHSGATHAKVSMLCQNSTFEIDISDDGKGIAPANDDKSEAQAALSGDGLHNMRQRLADLGGDCKIHFHPGRGTYIRFKLPLKGLSFKAKHP